MKYLIILFLIVGCCPNKKHSATYKLKVEEWVYTGSKSYIQTKDYYFIYYSTESPKDSIEVYDCYCDGKYYSTYPK